MAGFGGATGVPKKYVDDLVAQSTATGDVQRISYGSSSYVGFCKSGNTVYASVRYVPSDGAINAWSSVIIGTLPAGYRPKFECRVPAATDRATSAGTAIAIGTDGSVTISARYNAVNDSSDRIQTTMTYIV